MASSEELTADGDGAELNVQQISDGGDDHATEQAAVSFDTWLISLSTTL